MTEQLSDELEMLFAIQCDAEREEVIESLSDDTLWHCHRLLSNTRIVDDTVWLPLIEKELFRRGLINPS